MSLESMRLDHSSLQVPNLVQDEAQMKIRFVLTDTVLRKCTKGFQMITVNSTRHKLTLSS